jgi:hypothetical protein
MHNVHRTLILEFTFYLVEENLVSSDGDQFLRFYKLLGDIKKSKFSHSTMTYLLKYTHLGKGMHSLMNMYFFPTYCYTHFLTCLLF